MTRLMCLGQMHMMIAFHQKSLMVMWTMKMEMVIIKEGNDPVSNAVEQLVEFRENIAYPWSGFKVVGDNVDKKHSAKLPENRSAD